MTIGCTILYVYYIHIYLSLSTVTMAVHLQIFLLDGELDALATPA